MKSLRERYEEVLKIREPESRLSDGLPEGVFRCLLTKGRRSMTWANESHFRQWVKGYLAAHDGQSRGSNPYSGRKANQWSAAAVRWEDGFSTIKGLHNYGMTSW